MGSFKKTPRPTDADLSKTAFGWYTMMRLAVGDVRSLHVCVQDELALIEQHVSAKVGSDPLTREDETRLAKHLDEAMRLLDVASAKLRRLRALVRG